jgi:thiol-disulfide isomerase/thioredoxin
MSATGVRGGGKFFVVLERISTVAVIVVALFVAFVYGSSYLHPSSSSKTAGKFDVPRGKVLALPGVQWQSSKASVVVVLSTKCVYCERSAPFYQKLTALIQQHGGAVKTVAVFPQNASDGQAFLSTHGLAMDQAVSVPLGVLGVHVTPTLLLVDRSGIVQDGWVGSLNIESQTAVLAAVTKSM